MILGPHVILPSSGYGDMLKVHKPAAVLYLDPGDSVPYLAPLTVGRFWIDTPIQNDMLNDPVVSGIQLADRCIESSRHNGITIWQGLNEPPVGDADSVARLCQFERARVQRLDEAGLTAAVFAFSVGWPMEDLSTHMLITDWYAEFMNWLPLHHYVMFHEYWYPTGPMHADSYDPFRPSRIDRQRYWPWQHPILIGECGIDVAGQAGDGWQGHCPPGLNLETWAYLYIEQLRQFQQLLKRDKRVKSAHIYTMGQYGWWSFETGDHWRQFAPLFSETLPEPVEVPDERIRVKLDDGSIIELELEEYLRGVLPAEIFPSWPMEALKAQAVIARSYAMAKRDERRTRGVPFDVYANTQDQVYNPELIHPRTDQAVMETEGIYLAQANEPYLAQYVSRCGREECLYCVGANGYRGITWDGRACQWGFEYLSGLGYTWEAICKAYYDNIQIVDLRSTDYNHPFVPIGDDDMAELFKTFAECEGILDPNLERHAWPSGKVTGSVCRIVPVDEVWQRWGNIVDIEPGPYWKVVRAALIPEAQAGQRTVIYVRFLDENGVPYAAAQCWFAYPTSHLNTGNWVGQFDNGGGNGDIFTYPAGGGEIAMGQNSFLGAIEGSEAVGPYIVGGHGYPTEVIAGFGLTNNHHICFIVDFQLTEYGGSDPTPDPNPAPDPDPAELPGCAGWAINVIKAIAGK